MKLYEQDEHQWKLQSAEQMRKLASQQTFDAELKQLFDESAQYLEEMAISERRELLGLMSVIMLHLLKRDYQPEMEGNSWKKSIKTARKKLERLVDMLPSLKNVAPSVLDKAYKYARKDAADETELNLNIFPKESPYTNEQVFDETFFGNINKG